MSKDDFMLAHGSAKHITEYLKKSRTTPFDHSTARKLANNPCYNPEHAQYLLNDENHHKRGLAFYINKHITSEDMDKHIQDPRVSELVIRHSSNPAHFETYLNQTHRDDDYSYVLAIAHKRGVISRKMIDFAKNHESESLRLLGGQLEDKFPGVK